MAVAEWIAEPLHTGTDELGEGIIWSARQQCLYWVDVLARKVLRHHPGRQGMAAWLAPDMPTALAECSDGRLLVTTRKAAWILDPSLGTFDPFCDIEPDQPENRCNDGRVGPDGRFWFGTMADNFQPEAAATRQRLKTGAIYSLSGAGKLVRHWQGLGCVNSIGFDPGHDRMYVGDSWDKAIYHAKTPADVQREDLAPFLAIPSLGTNDGSALDSHGTTWNARWGAGCIAAIDARGDLVGLVRVGNARPTCCIFGGPAMDTLYISTAVPQASGEAGGLFSVVLPVSGPLPWLFDLAGEATDMKEKTHHG